RHPQNTAAHYMTAEFSTIAISIGTEKGFRILVRSCVNFGSPKCLMARAQWQSGWFTNKWINERRWNYPSITAARSRVDIDLSPTRETGTEGLADSGPRNISYTTVAGFPRTRQFGGTSFKTTEPAETTAPSPIVTPARIRLPIAIQLPVRMRMGATLSLKSSRRISWLPVQRNDRRATQTLDSIVTCTD